LRVYLDETAVSSSEENLKKLILGAFDSLEVSGNLNDGGELFMNVGGVLI
jgi:hypothetical protein